MPSTIAETPVPLAYLNGHKAPVIALATCAHESSFPGVSQILASGSEDATARIWDCRNGRAIKAFKGFNDAVTSVCFPEKNSHFFYLSAGSKIYSYDLRKPDLIFTTWEQEFAFASEEINQICIDEKHKYLATADDSGEVQVIDLSTRRQCKKFRSKHENICMCIGFKPRRPWEVWSGGMDSHIIAWDFSRGSPIEKFNMCAPLAESAETSQVFNPPFVYSMSVSRNGRIVAAGLGDGNVRMLSQEKSTSKINCEWKQEVLNGGHGYTVTSIEFTKFSEQKLISAASNATIAIWDVSEGSGGTEDIPPDSSTSRRLVSSFKSNYLEKIECITTARDESGGNLFVAGSTKDLLGHIGIYAIQ